MSPYPQTSMKEIAADEKYSLVGGPFGSKLGRKDYRPNGVPVIRGANLPLDQKFSANDFVFVSEEKADDLRANLAFPGDVVVTQRGTLGQVGLIPDPAPFPRFVISQSQMKVTVDPSKANNEFVYYALRSPQVQHRILSSALTAGVPHINLGIFEDLRIPSPELGIQRKIAGALAPYDELIENNLRRIEILEEMAQTIYREWFVNFRFPGNEDVHFAASRLGNIPRDWRVGSLAEAANARRGLSWDREQETDDGSAMGVLTIPNIQRRLDPQPRTRLNEIPAKHIEEFSLKANDILMIGSNGNPERVGQTVLVPFQTTSLFASFLMRIRPLPEVLSPYLLFHQLRDARITQQLRAGAIGATGLRNIRITALRDVKVLIPPAPVQDAFEDAIRSTFVVISDLELQNNNLRATRDLLLPKLISGEIDVSELDIDTSWLTA